MTWLYYVAGGYYVLGCIGIYLHVVIANSTEKVERFGDFLHIMLWPISIPVFGVAGAVVFTYYKLRPHRRSTEARKILK